MNTLHHSLAALIVMSIGSVSAVAADTQVDPVIRAADGVWVGESRLLRFSNRVQAVIGTSDLDPGAAVTIWWRIYNRPQHCAVPFRCESSDLNNPRVDGSQLHAGAFVVEDARGEATLVASLYRVAEHAQGRENFSDSLTEPYLSGRGLKRPLTAEVELLISSHGRAVDAAELDEDAVLEQLLTPSGNRVDCVDQQPPAGTRAFRCGIVQRVDHVADSKR